MLLWTSGCMYLFKLVFLFSSDTYPGMDLLDYRIVLFLAFWGTSTLFSTVAVPVYIPANSVWGFPFLHILANMCYLWSFWCYPSWQVWGDYFIVVLICISLLINDVEHFFCACWPSVCLLWKNVYLGLMPPFKLGCLFSWYWVAWAVYIFWILTPYCSYQFWWNIFSHSVGCLFILSNFLCCANAFKSN